MLNLRVQRQSPGAEANLSAIARSLTLPLSKSSVVKAPTDTSAWSPNCTAAKASMDSMFLSLVKTVYVWRRNGRREWVGVGGMEWWEWSGVV